MLGAIIGDIVGSRFEHHNYKGKDFELCHPDCSFTDDSVLTAAIADALLSGVDYAITLKNWFWHYPNAGYGHSFRRWTSGDMTAGYESFGNGSAMRVSPVAWFFHDLDSVLIEAKKSAAVTHNHSEGIKGAQATASAIFLARQGHTKESIKTFIQETFQYDLDRSPDEIRPDYKFDVTCQGSVPEAICCFLHSVDFEDAIRSAISIGGDSDTIACIAGSIAEPFFGIPDTLAAWAVNKLDDRLKHILERFRKSL